MVMFFNFVCILDLFEGVLKKYRDLGFIFSDFELFMVYFWYLVLFKIFLGVVYVQLGLRNIELERFMVSQKKVL